MEAFAECGGTTSNTGVFTFSVRWSWSFTGGDPHFTTLDGASYTYNGKGDFWYVSYHCIETINFPPPFIL